MPIGTGYSPRAAVLGHIGRLDDAAVAIDRINALNPDFASNVEDETRVFVKDEAFAVFFLDGLRKAGLFDEPEAPSRPVIAVLPFTNMSGDPEQEYFAAGSLRTSSPNSVAHPVPWTQVCLTRRA